MNETVHQGQITREAASAEGLSQRLLKDAAQQILTLIREALLRDGHVRIHNFGSFRLRWVKAHQGVNPRTGEPVVVPAHPRALFTPAKALREAVDSARDQAARNLTPPPVRPVPPLGVAASRLRTPTIVKRTRADVPSDGEGKSGIPEPTGPALDDYSRSEGGKRPWIAAALVAVIALLALMVFWPGQREHTEVAEAPSAKAIDRTQASPESTDQKITSVEEDDLSIAFTQSNAAIEQVVSASADTTIAAPTATQGPAPAEGEWLLRAVDRPVARSRDDADTEVVSMSAEARQTASRSVPGALNAPKPSGPTSAEPFFVGRDYQVSRGDNLWNLSGTYYLRPYYWPHIYNANQERIRNPNLIRTGSNLHLPALEGHPDDLTGGDRHSIAEGYFLLYRLFKRRSDPDAVFALSAVSHFDKTVVREHEAEIQASHGLEVEIAEAYGMRFANRIFVAHENVHFPTRLFE